MIALAILVREESPDSMLVSNIFRDRCQCELEGSDLLEKRATESYTAYNLGKGEMVV